MTKSNHKASTGADNSKKGKHTPKTGKTSAEIVKRHLSNKDDKITDDDLRNVRIDTSTPGDEAPEPLPIEPKKERPKDGEKDNTTLTSWDVISE